MTETPYASRKDPKQYLKQEQSLLSCKEFQKHSSEAAMETSWCKRPRHFISFLCHVGFHSLGDFLIHYNYWNSNHCIHIPESKMKKGEEERHISSLEEHCLKLKPPFSLISHWPELNHVVFILDGYMPS